jgi:hypothetical protein
MGGGVFFLFWGGKLNNEKKITKIKYNDGLRWPPFDILSCSRKTSQKHVGVMEGGRDRLRDRARMLGERDGNNEPLAEGNKDNDDKYGKDGDISDDNNEYAVGIDGVGKTLDEGKDQCCTRTSMPCKSAAKRALTLRASYSQWAALRV